MTYAACRHARAGHRRRRIHRLALRPPSRHQGEDVVVLDKLTYAGNRANLEGFDHEFFEGDITDPDAVARAAKRCDAIVNFAAETHVDRSILGPADFILTDVLGAQVLLDYARHNEKRLVHVSTDEVYGDIPLGAPGCTEDAPIRTSSPYSASKAGGELQVLAYVRTFGVDALITRGANTYGPRQYPEKFLPLFITNAFDGLPLPVYGDGKQRREWLHVEDHCDGIELALRGARPARRTTSAARSARTSRWSGASST